MSNKQGIIIAGDEIYAGLDEDDATEIKNCVVVYFKEKEDMKKFIKDTGWFIEQESK